MADIVIETLEDYQELRRKWILEGAVAYIYELLLNVPETIEGLKAKLDQDWESAAGSVACCLHRNLQWAGYFTGFLGIEKEPAEHKPHIEVTTELYGKLEKVAESKGLSVSDYVSSLVEKGGET